MATSNMDNVDELFSRDLVSEIAAGTDATEYDELGNPIASADGVFVGSDDDDIIALDEVDVEDLLLDSDEMDSFDEMYLNIDAGDVSGDADNSAIIEGAGDRKISGIGDGEPTPDAGANPPPPILGQKKDKRTARSQAHAKKKAEEAAKPLGAIEESGIGEPEIMESVIGEADIVGEPTVADVPEVAETIEYEETETVLVAPGEDPNMRRSSKAKAAEAPLDDADDGDIDDIGAYDSLPDEEDIVEDEREQVEMPDWADSIRRKVNANVAHAFLLHGNVRDYMIRNISIKDGIVAILDPDHENFDIIAEYDQAHGISFYGADKPVFGTTQGLVGNKKGKKDVNRTLADAYREKFIEEMKESQKRLSMPEDEKIPNRDPVKLFTILSDMFDQPSEKRQAKILLFIDYSDLLVPDASSAQMKPEERKLAITLSDMGRSQMADDCGNVMIFIADDMTQLSTRIRSAESRIEQVKINIPDRDERADFIDNVLDVPENTLSDGTRVLAHPDSISKEQFAINSAGLSRIQIEDIMLRALSEDEPLTMQLMKERKQEIIREDYDDVLEIVDPSHGFERVGGMENIKQFFVEEIIEPVHAGEKEAVPMGAMMAGPPGVSKRLRHDEVIPTEKGWKTVDEINPGDFVFGRDGALHEVLGKSDPEYQEIFEVKLKDGRSLECSGDHLWTVYKKTHGQYKPYDMTTEQMFEKGVNEIYAREAGTNRKNRKRFRLPMNAAAQYPNRDLPIDPYVMGAFLGDGCKNAAGNFILSSDDDFIPEEIARLLGGEACRGDGYSWHFYIEEGKRAKVKNVAPEYAELLSQTYSGDKYIPEEYKLGSIEQRWSLLQGLMDTDGCIVVAGGRYNTSFATTSERLAEDIMEVAYSLGMSCTRKVTRRAVKKIPEEEDYTYNKDLIELAFNIPPEMKEKLFRLPRKRERALEAAKHPKRRRYDLIEIADIIDTGEKDYCICLQVDTEDHLFLAGEYIVTHNTFLSKAVAKEAGMNFVELNLNRIMEKWVGSTERNLDRALDCALAMAPTIIFIDEIDEALPNRADPNASSVNKRINQRLLTFFSDTSHKGDVIILAATNYPEKIDPAFKRAGRFDVRLPIFAPNEYDRMRIMRVIAAGRGYEFSCLEDPDKIVENPFKRLDQWIKDGNSVDTNDKDTFFGQMETYSYTVKNDLGQDERHDIYLPVRIIDIIGKDKITLQQLYEGANILFTDMPKRTADAASGLIETDENYEKQILEYLFTREDVLGNDEGNIKRLHKRIWRWEKIYKSFVDQTFRMTGAELDVVMNKAINLFKKWKRKVGEEKINQLIEAGALQHDRDIPWTPFLYDACKKTVNAVAGIKHMEDQALINTSDTDFIPDALYIKTDDGRMISYRERHEALTTAQTKATLG